MIWGGGGRDVQKKEKDSAMVSCYKVGGEDKRERLVSVNTFRQSWIASLRAVFLKYAQIRADLQK